MTFPAGGSGFTHPLAGATGQLILPSFHSGNYNPGVAGWAIFSDGSAEFNNVTIRGNIIAGPTTGTRLVYDSTAGTLTAYDASNNITGQWNATTAQIQMNGTGVSQFIQLATQPEPTLFARNGNSFVSIDTSPSNVTVFFNPDLSKYNTGNITASAVGTGTGLASLTASSPDPNPSVNNPGALLRIKAASRDGTVNSVITVKYGGATTPLLDDSPIMAEGLITSVSLNAGYTAHNASYPPGFKILSGPNPAIGVNGQIMLVGGVNISPAGTFGNVFTLPVGFRPAFSQRYTVPTSSHTTGNSCRLDVAGSTGVVSILSNVTGYAPTFCDFDGCIVTL